MSFLGRLKAKIANTTLETPSVGFVGDQRSPLSQEKGLDEAFVGFVGEVSRGILPNTAEKICENPPHHQPTKPTKGAALQTDPHRCFVCGLHETDVRPLLPVCTDTPGRHHWLHSGCWTEHVRRCAAARQGSPA